MLKCEECGFEQEKTILSHVRQVHGMSAKEYKAKHNAPTRESWMKDKPEEMKKFYSKGAENLRKITTGKPSMNSLNGKWSKKHKKCVQCKSTEYAHKSLGMCEICYKDHRNEIENERGKEKTRAKNAEIMEDGVENEDYVICRICHEPFLWLADYGHLKIHNIKTSEYKDEFPNYPMMAQKILDYRSEATSAGRILLKETRGYINSPEQCEAQRARMIKKNREGGFEKVSGIERKFANWMLNRGYHIQIGDINAEKSPKIVWQYNFMDFATTDFADPERKIIIEIMGDYWHGWEYLSGKKEFDELDGWVARNFVLDKKRFKKFAQHEWNAIKFWGHDIRNDFYLEEICELFPDLGLPIKDYSAEDALKQFRDSLQLTSESQ